MCTEIVDHSAEFDVRLQAVEIWYVNSAGQSINPQRVLLCLPPTLSMAILLPRKPALLQRSLYYRRHMFKKRLLKLLHLNVVKIILLSLAYLHRVTTPDSGKVKKLIESLIDDVAPAFNCTRLGTGVNKPLQVKFQSEKDIDCVS